MAVPPTAASTSRARMGLPRWNLTGRMIKGSRRYAERSQSPGLLCLSPTAYFPLVCRVAAGGLDLLPMAEGPRILPNVPKVPAAGRGEALPYEPVCAIFRRYLHGQQ